jgi:glyoxylase-like metal-dependent hydrolase (beta-lactamase superfamily II)
MKLPAGIHRFGSRLVNWYVLEEGGRLTVVDAGFPGHWPQLLAALPALGRRLGDVEAVVLTHAHADHKGFAEQLRRTTGAAVWVHEADRALALRRDPVPPPGFRRNLWRPTVRGLMLHALRAGAFWGEPVRDVATFRDGEVLAVPGRPVAIHVPGHVAGEVALHLPERRALLSGDALVTVDLYTGRFGPPRLLAEGLNEDTAEAYRSLEKLEGLGGVALLPGHGDPWVGDAAEAVRLAVRGWAA